MDSELNGTASHALKGMPGGVAGPVQAVTTFNPTMPTGMLWASWDQDTEEGFAELSRVLTGETVPLQDAVGSPIDICNIVVQSKESVSEETGEVSTYPLIHLVGADGMVYLCGSRGVYQSLCMILRHRPKTPWQPPVRVIPQRKSLGKGRQWLELRYVIAPPSPQGGA